MKNKYPILGLWSVLFGGICIASMFTIPVKAQDKRFYITLYHNSPAVVHELKTVSLNKGINHLSEGGIPSSIIPSSITVSMPVKILDQQFIRRNPSEEPFPGNGFIGKHIRIIDPKGNVYAGVLVSLQPGHVVFKRDDGSYLLLQNMDGYTVSVDSMHAEITELPRIDWTSDSPDKGKKDVSIIYLTNNLDWATGYTAILNNSESMMKLTVDAFIRNRSGVNYDDAGVNLIAGTLNGVRTPGPVRFAAVNGPAGIQIPPQNISDYHMYQVDRKLSLISGGENRVTLFRFSDIPVNITYEMTDRKSDGRCAVMSHILLRNSKANGLGEPLPAGVFRAYLSQGNSRILIGRDDLPATAEEEPLHIKLGEAFDLAADQITKSVRKIGDKMEVKTIGISVRNHKKISVTVEIPRNVGPDGIISNSTLPYKRISAGHYSFSLTVPAGRTREFTYTVRTTGG